MLESQDNLEHFQKELGERGSDFRNNNLFSLIAGSVVGQNVCDIGCSSGKFLSNLPDGKRALFGLEPGRELVESAQKVLPRATILQGVIEDLQKLPLPSFDTITMLDVLEHIEDDRAALAHVFDKLKPGGRFVVVVPAYQALYGKRDAAYGHYRRYGKAELISKLQNAGFKIESCRYWNMLGVIPYFISEKLFGKVLTRVGDDGSKSLLASFLSFWFKHVENNINFGLGLSLIFIAEKPTSN